MLLSCFLFLFLLFVCVFEVLCMSNKDAGSDSEAFRLQPVKAITASVQPESGRIVYAGSDFLHPIRFRFVLAKRARIILRKTGPDPIRMAWSSFGRTDLARKQAGVQESSGPVLLRPATSFQLSDGVASNFQTRLHPFTDGPDRNIVQNQP